MENLDWKPDVDICKGQINLDQIFWLRDLPWAGVGVSGGFLVSSLCGTLSADQDIDLYVLNFDILGNLIQHFVRAVPDLQIYAPITYQDGFSILTLKSDGQRPLQIICSGHGDMSAVVRTFDLSHLKIWLDENGLRAEVTALKELLMGYSRVIRRGNKTPERIEKYTQRGWFIFGDNNFLKYAPPCRPNLELTVIDSNTCLQYCRQSKITMIGYIQNGGLHLGHIKDLTLADVQQLRVFDLGRDSRLQLFTPILLVIPITKLIIYSNRHQIYPAKAYATIKPELANQIQQIYDHLHTQLNVVLFTMPFEVFETIY